MVLAVNHANSWIEVRRSGVQSLNFNSQLLPGFHFEPETVQIARTRNRPLDHGWDRNALRLGSAIVGFVLQNYDWITRRLNLWRFRRGDHPNKTCLAGGELFDGSFRSFN